MWMFIKAINKDTNKDAIILNLPNFEQLRTIANENFPGKMTSN
jgi:hypothetical protein